MNSAPLFRETRLEVLQWLMREHPFATVVAAATGQLSAEHAPLVLAVDDAHPKGLLRGHLAIGNALYRETEGPFGVLAIFQGPQAYITPSWYPSKAEHGKVVPTWNYVAVHAHGTLRFIRDSAWLMAHLHTLTDTHEGPRPSPWSVADAPSSYVAKQLRGLVGFEIDLREVTGTWKLSQNKGAADRYGVSEGLRKDGDAEQTAVSSLVSERAGRPGTGPG